MQQRSARLRRDILEVIVWCLATPILAVWALVSLLPVVGVISNWGDPVSTLVAIAFFGTGAAALVFGLAGYRLLLWQNAPPRVPTRETRIKRVALLAVYASVWMLLYGLYSIG